MHLKEKCGKAFKEKLFLALSRKAARSIVVHHDAQLPRNLEFNIRAIQPEKAFWVFKVSEHAVRAFCITIKFLMS